MFSIRLRRVGRAAVMFLTAPMLISALGPRDNLELRLLAAHNAERSVFGVPPLQWDPKLAIGAQQWAHYLASSNRFEHSPDGPAAEPEGENLWAGTVDRYAPESMVALWAAEKENFRGGIFPNNSRTGHVESVSHYTQLIWARTGKVGCAVARGRQEDFLVCRYSQAGNVIGERPA